MARWSSRDRSPLSTPGDAEPAASPVPRTPSLPFRSAGRDGRDGRDEPRRTAKDLNATAATARRGLRQSRAPARRSASLNSHGTAGNDRKEQARTGTTGTAAGPGAHRDRSCVRGHHNPWMGSACARAPVCDTSRGEPPPSCRCLSFQSLPAVPSGAAMPLTERAHVIGAAPVAASRPSRSGLSQFVAPVAPAAPRRARRADQEPARKPAA